MAELDWVVLKIAQRCNLNCTYCYVYNRGDDSWRLRQPFITPDVTRALGARIAEQCEKYALERFVVELHGGEPLLVGKRRLEELVTTLRYECPSITLRVVLQTNGLLLDEEWLEVFDRNEISFGVSLDGPAEFADTVRVDHRGAGSTVRLLEIIERLRQAGPLFDTLNAGALCVINPEADGGQMVRWFAQNGFKGLDFLLPLGHYANYPDQWSGPEPYLRFFLSAFNEWYSMGASAPRIRTFELMMGGFMGSSHTLDALGGDLRGLCVVESDGSMGVSDNARICGPTFARDSLNVFLHPLDAHASHYNLEAIQSPCSTCRSCRYFKNCGGGYLPHRFDGFSFSNPSIYCHALYGLADEIYRRLREAVPEDFWIAAR